MVFHSLDGTTVLFPTFGDRALMGVTPLAFLGKVLATNRSLGYRNVAEYDIDSIFKRMLASACVTSYEIKAERKGILERWVSSPDWATVRQILRGANVPDTGRKPKASIPLEIRYTGTKTLLPVQLISERTREKLVRMGKTLRVCLPSRVNTAALTNTTHVHLVGHNETGGPNLYEVKVITAFHPSVAIEFKNRCLLDRFLEELPTSAFSFDYDRVANVVAEKFNANTRETIYTLGSGPIDEGCAIHESLKRFFVNKGYVANSDVVFKKENGVEKGFVVVRCKGGPKFMRKLGAVPGHHQDQFVPATFAETCSICRPGEKRAQSVYRECFQVEPQSRQELDFSPTGPPKVKLPGQEATPLRDVHSNITLGPKPFDDGPEDAREKLKIAKKALTSKLKRNNLPAKLQEPEPRQDGRNNIAKERSVVEDDGPPKRKHENSPDTTGLEPSRNGSKDARKKPKFEGKEVLTSEDCAELTRDFLTELEESWDRVRPLGHR